jgi:hypothetical protein
VHSVRLRLFPFGITKDIEERSPFPIGDIVVFSIAKRLGKLHSDKLQCHTPVLAVYIAFDSIAAVVQQKDDRFEIMSHHDGQFLDSQLTNNIYQSPDYSRT